MHKNRLEDNILDFCRLLRKGGINVSHSQIVDSLRALEEVGLEKDSFYQALCCNLVTEDASLPLFSRIFRLYFSYVNKAYDDQSALLDKPVQLKKQVSFSKGFSGEGNAQGGGFSLLMLFIQAIRERNYALLFSLAQLAVKGLGKLGFNDLQNLEETIERAKINLSWYEAVNRLEKIKIKEEVNEYTYNQWLKGLSFTEEKIRELLEKLFIALYGKEAIEEIVSHLNLDEKDFYRLNKLEVKELRLKIKRLAKKLAIRNGRRYKKAKHGRIDLRLTAVEAFKKGKIPFTLKYKQKIPDKPELILLCDSSGSVDMFSEFMLQLVYTFQNRFRSVRSFLFVDTLAEVSHYFKKNDVEEALGMAFNKSTISVTGFSNFGKVFELFTEKYLSGVSTRTTLIVLGDARNNWQPDGREFLDKIRNNVRKIIWFNPQPLEKWDTEDSIMNIYAAYCHQVFECRNLKQLEQAAEAIL